MTKLKVLFASGCCLLAFSGSAHAQTADTPPAKVSSTQRKDDQSGDIVVTAQRETQSLRDVPIAISVVGGDALTKSASTQLSNIREFATSVQFLEVPSNPTFSVRGVGTQSFDGSVEQAVGIAIDDVNVTLPRSTVLNMLSDVERVEVLRGPQGTLFGKNTTAGLISIVTRKPELRTYGMTAHVQFGSRDELQSYAIANLPVGDNFALRLRAGYQMRDPVTRVIGGGSIPSTRDYNFDGKFLWQPMSRLTIYGIADYQSTYGDPGEWTVRKFGVGTTAPALGNTFVRDTLTALGIVPGPENDTTALDAQNYASSKTYGGQLQIDYDLGFAKLTSLTAFYRNQLHSALEADETPVTALDDNITDIRAKQFVQELRLSHSSASLDYVAGLYYFSQQTNTEENQSGGLGYLPNGFPLKLSSLGGLKNYSVDSKSAALFGQATYRITPRLRLILGGRLTWDDISASTYTSELPGVCGFELLLAGVCHAVTLPTAPTGEGHKQVDWSSRTGLQFDLAPRTVAYATVSRGYKGAAISTVSGSVFYVAPETVWSYELGLKSDLFSHRLQLNGALFYSKFTNFQTGIFDPKIGQNGAFRTGNAGGLESKGAELEILARPAKGLTFTGGVTYNDAHFTNYRPPCYTGQTAAQGCTLPGPAFDAAGDVLANSPRWSFSAGMDYEAPLGDHLKGFIDLGYSWRSSVLFGVGDPNTLQPAYGLANATIGIADADDHLRVSVFVRNAFDRRFVTYIAPSPFDSGGYSQFLPDGAYRRIGVALDIRF